MAEVGLTPTQHQLLLVVRGSEADGGPTIREVSEACCSSITVRWSWSIGPSTPVSSPALETTTIDGWFGSPSPRTGVICSKDSRGVTFARLHLLAPALEGSARLGQRRVTTASNAS